ncbi:MAG: hypothetical protein QXX08_02380 [Candidatus Bathyarchaeia archaeon]
MLRIIEELAKDVDIEFAGAILRPHAFLMEENKEKAKIIIEASKQAGVQLIKDGKITDDILETISRPLISEDELRRRYNESYMKVKRGQTPQLK